MLRTALFAIAVITAGSILSSSISQAGSGITRLISVSQIKATTAADDLGGINDQQVVVKKKKKSTTVQGGRGHDKQ